MNVVLSRIVVATSVLAFSACTSLQTVQLHKPLGDVQPKLSDLVRVNDHVEVTLTNHGVTALTVTSVDDNSIEGTAPGKEGTLHYDRAQILELKKSQRDDAKTGKVLAIIAGAVALFFVALASLKGATRTGT